jgi:hypothetical protein
MAGGGPANTPFPITVVPVIPGEERELTKKRNIKVKFLEDPKLLLRASSVFVAIVILLGIK